MKKFLSAFIALMMIFTLLSGAVYVYQAKGATSPTIKLGSNYATLANAVGTKDQHYLGEGSWKYNHSTTKFETYIAPDPYFGREITIDDIQSISFHTNKPLPTDGSNPYNFFLVIYTKKDGVNDKGSWFGYRLESEPYFANNLDALADTWVTWTTDSGTNQLRFFDPDTTGTYGTYTDPFLQDIQAGVINWNSYYSGYPTTNIDYGPEKVLYFSFQTGSAWSNSFDGYLDGIIITLKSGDSLTIDLEDGTDTVWVDDDWAGSTPGIEVAPGKFYGYNAFNKIQDGIDAVSAGGTVNVFPGNYNQDEANGYDPLTGGSGSSNFNIFVNKPVTIQGVKADGTPITNANDVAAFVIPKRDTPSGNLSTIFVQADNVTISGLDITAYNDSDYNFKTISVIGNNVTIKNCKIHALDQVSCIYMYDPRYNSSTDISYITTYRIEGNILIADEDLSDGTYASGIRISSGPGWTGDVVDRLITGNTFTNGSYGIEFVGAGGDPWDVYPVGAATINGNNFTGQDKGSVIAWGKYKDTEGYGALDWDGIFANNTFDKSVIVKKPDNTVEYYDDVSGTHNFYFIRGIYSGIQRYPISKVAQSGDTIMVGPGTYTEQILIQKSLTLVGAGKDVAIVKAPATLPPASDPSSSIVIVSGASVNAEISGFTIEGPGPSRCGSISSGIFVRDGANAYIHNNQILDIRDNPFSGCQNGIAIQIGQYSLSTSGTATIENNIITGYQKGGIVVDNAGSSAIISNNVITGAGTTDVTAQNGIQISRGATATISGNKVSGNSYHKEGSSWDYGACGILLYQSGTVSLTGGNNLTGNDQNYYAFETTGTLSLGAEVFGASTAPITKGYHIVLASNTNLDASSCTFEGVNPASATLDQLFAIEDRIWHTVDDPTYTGLVRVKPGNIYVTHTEPTAKIEYGVDAAMPGDTVNVAAGTYTEPQIIIDKPLTLRGAGIDQSIIDGGNATLTNKGLIRIVAFGNVTVEGFTIKNAGGPSVTDNGDGKLNVGIYTQSDSDAATYTISNVKILGTNNPNDEEDYGLYSHGGKETLILTHSIITETSGNAILMERHTGPTEISYNTLDAGCYGIDPIFYMTYGDVNITTLQKISNNTIDVSTGITSTDNVTAISFMGAFTHGDDDLGNGKFTNILIEGNTITGLRENRRGISLYNDDYGDGTGGEIAGAIIRNNTITGTGSPSSNCFGIRLAGYITNTNINHNVISGANVGVLVTTARNSWSVVPVGTIVNYNSISNNVLYEIKWDGDGATWLDARYNWWGSADGPAPSKIYGLVQYIPYLTSWP